MPLKKGKTDKIISKNISELMGAYGEKGKIGTSKPKSKKKAQKQAVAIALQTAGKSKMDETTAKFINQDIANILKEETKATCCGKCGRVHVKGTKCKKPYLTGKKHCKYNP